MFLNFYFQVLTAIDICNCWIIWINESLLKLLFMPDAVTTYYLDLIELRLCLKLQLKFNLAAEILTLKHFGEMWSVYTLSTFEISVIPSETLGEFYFQVLIAINSCNCLIIWINELLLNITWSCYLYLLQLQYLI